MKDTRCELVRRELEELTLNEAFSDATAEHVRGCADCRNFQRQQTRLRQIVGSLGTVNAPPDFDFRLRARLAADSQRSGFRSFAVKGFATAAVLVVFGVGGAIVWQHSEQQGPVAEAPPTRQTQPDQHVATTPPTPNATPAPAATPTLAVNHESKPKVERPFVVKPKRTLTAFDFSSQRANVISNTRPAVNNESVFPIEASLQSLKVSLDDGRGNARTISFPTVSFGSQRVLTNANQFAPKGVW
jgi:hypothetical protein